MKPWALAALVCASPLSAQGFPFDTVKTRPSVSRVLQSVAQDSLGAWCVVRGRRDARGLSVYVDSLVEADAPINPDCGDRPVVLKRPPCMFAPSEFVWLRPRARYVIVVCGDHTAFGIPLTPATPGAGVV